MTTTISAKSFPTTGTNNIAARKRRSGFTLIEVIAVLVVLGILAAVALPRYVDLTTEARSKAVDAAVAELNGRESLEWAKAMLAGSGTVDDATIEVSVTANNGDLGPNWTLTGDEGSYTLTFEPSETDYDLTRASGDNNGPAIWSRPAPPPAGGG